MCSPIGSQSTPRTTVLLIEAGPRDTSARDPQAATATSEPIAILDCDGPFPLTADAERGECQGMFIAGKVLGGTSSINGMVYVRGVSDDYDGWAESGAPGWGWKTCSRASRAWKITSSAETNARGAGGPLHVSPGDLPAPSPEAVIQAGISMGLSYSEDINDSPRRAHRLSPEDDRSRPACERGSRVPHARSSGRPNLTVLTDTPVTHVVFEGTRAVGVACMTNGTHRRHSTRRRKSSSAPERCSPRRSCSSPG